MTTLRGTEQKGCDGSISGRVGEKKRVKDWKIERLKDRKIER